ncbi:MAG: alpha/beta fold hydrolase [Marinosulfonomonas sp.]
MVAARLTELGGEGPDLLLIHGYGSDSMAWSGMVAPLVKHRRVLAVDLPGHGKAPAEVGDGRADTLARAVLEQLGDVQKPIDILGHSLGGAVALALQDIAPGFVASLSLMAPVGFGQGVDPAFLDAYPKADTDEALHPLLLQLVARPQLIQPAMVSYVLAGLDRPGRRQALETIAGAIKTHKPLELPKDIPVHLIWGDQDRINPFAEIEDLPDTAKQHVMPGCGHMPHLEAATKTARLLVSERLGAVQP